MSNKFEQGYLPLPITNILLDNELNILDLDHRASKLLGIQKSHLGKNLLNISTELLLNRAEIKDYLALEPSNICTQRNFFNKNGQELLLQLSPATGPFNNKILTIIDLSSLHNTHKELELKEQASKQNLKEFTYIASHDLQAPLRHITAYIDLLYRRHHSSLNNEVKSYLDEIGEAAKHMKLLISCLCEYSRIKTHGNELELSELDDILIKALKKLHPIIQQHGAKINYSELPTLKIDRQQITQLFTHLISNAIHFNDKAEKTITINAYENTEEWEFCISDNGIGIDVEVIDKIFLIFKRSSNNQYHNGLGTGLAMSKQIVERHGGRIWAESNISQGSRFFFTLPKPP